MLDISEAVNGNDLTLTNSAVMKAGNLLSIQLGVLDYAPDFGVDFKYFLESNFQIQIETFKTYLIQRMTENQINVTEVAQVVSDLFSTLNFGIGDSTENLKGFIL